MASDKLLILDIDGTLVFTDFEPLAGVPGVNLGADLWMMPRPHLDVFLAAAQRLFTLGIWTTALAWYAHKVIDQIGLDRASLHCTYTRAKCSMRWNEMQRDFVFTKPLKKVKDFPLSKILILDDTPSTYQQNYGNAIPIPSWEGDMTDTALLDIIPLLERLATVDDVRAAPHG